MTVAGRVRVRLHVLRLAVAAAAAAAGAAGRRRVRPRAHGRRLRADERRRAVLVLSNFGICSYAPLARFQPFMP